MGCGYNFLKYNKHIFFFFFFKQNFLVKIQNATISAVNDESSDDFSAKLQLLTVLLKSYTNDYVIRFKTKF